MKNRLFLSLAALIIVASCRANSYTDSRIFGFEHAERMDTCPNPNSAPRITAISRTGGKCVDGMDSLRLLPSVFPVAPGQYRFQWNGPNGYSSMDSIAIIPKATAADSGMYHLFVTTLDGCRSEPDSILVDITNIPSRPVINQIDSVCSGENLRVSLKNSASFDGPSTKYTWLTPQGTLVSMDSMLQFISATTNNAGNYSVLVTQNGCTTDTSLSQRAVVHSIPSPIVASSNSPVCLGDTIKLFADTVNSASYRWLGPNGFNSTLQNPTVATASSDDTGSYQVQITVNNCVSPFSDPEKVEVIQSIKTPAIQNNGPVCIDDNTILTLFVSDDTYQEGVAYTWFDAQSLDPVAGPVKNDSAQVVNLQSYTDGDFGFFAIASLGECRSEPSNTTLVSMTVRPDEMVNLRNDIKVCNSTSVTLKADNFEQGSGQWRQVAGPMAFIEDDQSASTEVKGLQPGNAYGFRWGRSVGVCGEFSADSLIVTVGDTLDLARATDKIERCDSSVITLNAQAPAAGNRGKWRQSPDQAALGVTIENGEDPNTTVTGLLPGRALAFYWTLSNEACGEFSSDTTEVIIYDSANKAYAGEDQAICGNPTVTLTANDIGGIWSSPDMGIDIANPSQMITFADGLRVGINLFIRTVDNGTCGISKDTALVGFEEALIAVDDQVTLDFVSSAEVAVTANDSLPGPFVLQIFSEPSRGKVILSDQMITYTADPDFVGVDRFVYEVCSLTCPEACATALVTVMVNNEASCQIPTIFTPNDDGVNDVFSIPCLTESSDFFNNSVTVFNQWGDEVFRSSPYKNDWQGTYKGEKLPVGTYFFIVEFGNGKPSESGFLVLER